MHFSFLLPSVRAVLKMFFMLSGYDYPCHPNLENICARISAYLHTHPGMSQDVVEEDAHKWTHTVKPANAHALKTE